MASGEKPKTEKQKPATENGNGANIGFETQLLLAADKFRGNSQKPGR